VKRICLIVLILTVIPSVTQGRTRSAGRTYQSGFNRKPDWWNPIMSKYLDDTYGIKGNYGTMPRSGSFGQSNVDGSIIYINPHVRRGKTK